MSCGVQFYTLMELNSFEQHDNLFSFISIHESTTILLYKFHVYFMFEKLNM
jgi:hypothetical protein